MCFAFCEVGQACGARVVRLQRPRTTLHICLATLSFRFAGKFLSLATELKKIFSKRTMLSPLLERVKSI